MAGDKEIWMREANDNREAWSGFRASCVNLAEQLLEMRKIFFSLFILTFISHRPGFNNFMNN